MSLPRLTAAFVALASLAPSSDAQSGFIYTLRESGTVFVNGTQLEKAPGSYVSNDDSGNSVTTHRYQDMEIQGADRWLLRVDGRIQKNGIKAATLPFPPISSATLINLWWRLHLDDAGQFYAMRLDGLISANGVVLTQHPIDLTKPPEAEVFTDITSRTVDGQGTIVYSLREDGYVFSDEFPLRPGFRLDPEAGFAPQDNPPEGITFRTQWLHLVYDPTTDQLYAMRIDGTVMIMDPFDFDPAEIGDGEFIPNGVVEADLPSTLPNVTNFDTAYVDFELLSAEVPDPGAAPTWFALRQDGKLFSSSQAPPSPTGDWEEVVDLAGGQSGTSPYVGLAIQELEKEGLAWAGMRFNGKIHAGLEGDEILDVKGNDFLGVGLSTTPPDLTNFKPKPPTASIYRTKVVAGNEVTIPIILADIDTATDELIVTLFDEKRMPVTESENEEDPDIKHYAWDPKARTMTIFDTAEKGNYRFRIEVEDDSGKKPKKFNYPIKVIKPDDNPDKNKPPIATTIKKLTVFAEQTISFPILATDKDPEDTLTIEVIDLKGDDIFDEGPDGEAGAEFDPETGLVTWTPGFDMIGKHRAVFWVFDDGDPQRKRKLNVKLEVVAQLVFDEVEEG